MTSYIALLAASLTIFSSALAFSPDQCNVTSYGRPDKAACTTLLTTISNMGVGNTSYLFIPSQFPTPEGLSNGTRKDFPQSWSNAGCMAALVPIEVTSTSVTFDTSSYQDLAAAGTVVVQQCISNSTGAGGWELAGDNQDLVLHVYAAGSQIDSTIKKQTKTEIAATSEDEIDDAEIDDPDFASDGDISGDAVNGTAAGNATNAGGGTAAGAGTGSGSGSQTTTASTSVTAVAAAAKVVPSSGTFKYLGCQADSATSRTLSSLSWTGTGLTVERCAAYCAEYQYMGVEFGSQCYCGGDAKGKGVKPATLVTSATNQCTVPCNGDPTQLCGGAGWLNVYQSSNSATAGATA